MLDLLLADARTPTGGFAQSGGIEPARLQVVEIPAFLRGRLGTVGSVDAAVAAAAARGSDPITLDMEWAARTPAEPVRRAAGRQGRALLRLAAHIRPGALDDYATASTGTPRPVVLGLLGRALDLAPLAIARVCLYDDAATCCAAVPKLYAIDAATAAGWLVELAPLIDRLAQRAAAATATALPASSAPLLDVRAVLHATDTRRLFVT
jgi:urease accessory protein